MPAAIPLLVLAGAEAAFGVGIAAQLAAAAAAVAVGSFESRKAKKKASSQSRDLTVTLQSAVAPRRTVYGRARVSGPLVYAVSEGSDNKFLHRVIPLAGHEIDAFEKVYFNDDELALGAALPATNDFSQPTTGGRYMENGQPVAHIEGKIGGASQTAMATLIAASAGQWTGDHRLQGVAYLRAQTNYTPQVYTEGLPNVSALIRGKKLYDGRSGQTVWSDNPALVIRDYLVNALAVPSARIDQASFDAAANLCDEYVTMDTAATADPAAWAAYMVTAINYGTWEFVGGTTVRQRRYRFNGVVESDDTPGEVLEQMVQACAGWLSYTGGVWRLVAGGYTAPTLTLTERDLRGGPSFRPRPGRRDLFNVARGTYTGPATRYVATDWPPLVSSAFVTADGGQQMPLDLDLPFTNDAVAAQRLGSIYLQRSRQGVLTFPATLTALALRPGDTVAITLPRFGFAGEVFRVEGWQLAEDLGVDLVLREEAAAIYTWAPGATIRDPSPQLNLPSPFTVPAVTGLTATSGVATNYVQNDGTIIQRTLLSWNTTGNAFARFVQIQSRLVGTTEWTPHPDAEDAQGKAYLTNLKTGSNHEIRARRLNTVGAAGAWTTINYTPSASNASVNLLRNSNWTEDLGYGTGTYPDARALRQTLWGHAGVGTIAIGRNYANGTAWNIGPGGMYFYQSGSTPGDFQFIYQRVPAQPGVTYEASVAVNPHRCAGKMYLRWIDASLAYISDAMGGPDSVDAGAGTVGGQVDITTHPRLWRSGVAPANTAYIEVLCLKDNTTAGQADSYAFFSRAMLCVAPPGVTKETATPWSDESTPFPSGVARVFTNSQGGTGARITDFVSIPTGNTFVSFTSPETSVGVDLKAGDRIVVDVEYAGYANTASVPGNAFGRAAFDILVTGSGKTKWVSSGPDATGNVKQAYYSPYYLTSNTQVTLTCTGSYVAASDQSVTVYATGGSVSSNEANLYTNTVNLRVTVYRA
jgi:hypothetical protein